MEKRERGALERQILESESWKKGYNAFNALLKKPLGWLFLSTEARQTRVRVNRKSCCSWYCQSSSHERKCETYLQETVQSKIGEGNEGVKSFTCHAGRSCAAFPFKLHGENRGYFVACNLKQPLAPASDIAAAFHEFLKMEVSLAQKSFELQNFYETVHPRALALSTMHSVHRVISTAFNLDELLPRIARLCMQILKVKHCSILLVDDERKYLISKFSTEFPGLRGPVRRKIGKGLEGRIAATGEIYLSRGAMALPFVDQDVIGVIVLKEKINGRPFTMTDLEILKILSEQTLVAIKNAQLYEQSQQLTLGIIKSLTNLLELDFAGDNVHLPLFKKLVREVGMDLGLSRRDLTDLDRGVLLLDTGYIGIPENILSKKTKLTRKEFDTIKKHPDRGAHVLRSITSLRSVVPIILHHHERWDGKGYPRGLKGDEIPITARIVAVVDSFTAMISKRPYREGRKVTEALEEIRRNSGTQFDPKVVESFLKVFPNIDYRS